MASAYKCDRCGKYCLNEKHGFCNVEIKGYTRLHGVYSTSNNYDLCPECKDELYNFLKAKEEVSNE